MKIFPYTGKAIILLFTTAFLATQCIVKAQDKGKLEQGFVNPDRKSVV